MTLRPAPARAPSRAPKRTPDPAPERARLRPRAGGFALPMLMAALALGGIVAGVIGSGSVLLARMSREALYTDTARMVVKQATMRLVTESADIDNDGFPEPPAMDTGGSTKPAGGGNIPATSAAPKGDAWGTALGYCAWDNGATSTSAGRISGDSPASQSSITLAVISAGPDKTFQTSCAQARANAPQGDDIVMAYSNAQVVQGVGGTVYWGDPVTDYATLAALPAPSLHIGEQRMVKDTGQVLRWDGNSWTPTNGVATVDANGNVGIGHGIATGQSMFATLNVDKGAAGEALRIGTGANDQSMSFGGKAGITTSGNAVNMILNANGQSNQLVLAGSGNVGIGTASPTARLTSVGGQVNLTGPNRTLISSSERVGGYCPSGVCAKTDVIQIGGYLLIDDYGADGGNNLKFRTSIHGYTFLAADNPVYRGAFNVVHADNVSKLYINQAAGGFVGIGTNAPTQLLDLNGTGRIRAGLLLDQAAPITFANGQTIRDNGLGGLAINSNNYSLNLVSGTDASAAITFATNGGSERMRIANHGYVGIGTTNPQYALDVAGDINASGNLYATGSVYAANVKQYTLSRNLPTTVGDTVDIGYFAQASSGHSLDVAVTVAGGGYSSAKRFLLPVSYCNGSCSSGTWSTALPLSSTGAYAGNDAELEVMQDNALQRFNLRLRRTAGAVAGPVSVSIHDRGPAADTFTARSAVTAAPAAASGSWNSTALTQVGGNVGVGTSTPATSLHLDSPLGSNLSYARLAGQNGGVSFSSNNNNGMIELLATGGAPAAKLVNTTGGWRWTNNLNIVGGSSIGSTYAGIAPPTSGLIVEGNVGIGTAAPTARLAINNAASTVAALDIVSNSNVIGSTNTAMKLNMSSGSVNQSNTGISVTTTASSEGSATGLNIALNARDSAYGVYSSVAKNWGGNALFGTAVGIYGAGSTDSSFGTSYGGYFENLATAGTGYGVYVHTTAGAGTTIPFAVAHGASELMRVASSGNVGIGSASPSQKLHVAGNAYITGALYDNTNSPGTSGQLLTSSATGTAWQSVATALGSTAFMQGGNSFGALAVLGTNDNNALSIRTNGAEGLRIDTAGNVGIGTATPGLNRLAILSSGDPAVATAALAVTMPVHTPSTSTQQYGVKVDMQGGRYANNQTGIYSEVTPWFGSGYKGVHGVANISSLAYASSYGLYGQATNTAANFGVRAHGVYGTATSLNGGVGNIGNGQGAIAGKFVANGEGNAYGVVADAYLSGTPIGGAVAVPLLVSTNGTELLRVMASGNVGIGTASPSTKLHVAGNAYITGAIYDSTNSPGTSGQLLTSSVTGTAWQSVASALGSTAFLQGGNSFGALAVLGTNDANALALRTNGAERLRIDTAGNVGIGLALPTEKLHVAGNVLADRFIGYGAGGVATNSAVGSSALAANITGYYNTANGVNALLSNTTGFHNTADGTNALRSNTTGAFNTANGMHALYSNTTASNNTATGAYALYANTSGDRNAAHGTYALQWNTTGYFNSAFGYLALSLNTTGFYNSAAGTQALRSNTTGTQNSAFGVNALYDLTTGSNNTAIGFDTGMGITTGSNNTILGANVSGLAAGLSNNIIIADGSGNQRINVDASGNVGIGSAAPSAKLDVVGAVSATGLLIEKVIPSNPWHNKAGIAFAQSGPDNATASARNVGLIFGGSASQNNKKGGIFFAEDGTGFERGTLILANNGASNVATSATMADSVVAITSAGNVGVGTTTPTDKLHVVGGTTIQGPAALTHGTLSFVRGSGALMGTLGMADPNAGNSPLQLHSTNGNDIIFTHNAVERMRIQTGGNVGIGLASPTEKLHVAGNVLADRFIGYGAGAITSNTAVGASSLLSNTTGIYNTATGVSALQLNTTGGSNTATGTFALGANTTGSNNTALGARALAANTTADYNVAIGSQALQTNTNGYSNVATGFTSLLSNTTGAMNTAYGDRTMLSNTTGTSNTAIGKGAMFYNTTGGANAAVGAEVMQNNTTGNNNVAMGYQTLFANTTGSQATALGLYALRDVTVGNNNTALGYNTGRGITTGSNNTILGANVSGLAAGLSNNIIIADGSGNQRINVDASGNVGLGTTTPAARLDVTGTANISGMTNIAGGNLTQGNLNVYSATDPGTRPYGIYVKQIGVGGGTAVPQYGIYVDASQSYNGASASYGVYAKAYQNIGGTSYGVWGETLGGNSWGTFHGVHGLATSNSAANGGGIGVYGEATTTGNSMTAVTYAGYFTNNTQYANTAVGLYANATTGPTNVIPLMLAVDGVEKLRVSAAGNLGLGTTAPSQKLHVAGNAYITGALYDSTNSPGTSGQLLTSTVTGTAWQSASTVLGSTAFLQGGNSFGALAALGTNDANALAIRTNGSEQMRIDASGNVGIGTTSPAARLDVNGVLKTKGLFHNVLQVGLGTVTTNGIKIKTNIPSLSSEMPTVVIEGYDYRAGRSLGIVLNWYGYAAGGGFYAYTASSFGAQTPTIRLSMEGGKVVIHLANDKSDQYYNRFNVRVLDNGSNPAYYAGWSMADEAVTGTGTVVVPYQNRMGTLALDGSLGIGTTAPGQKLHVVGNAYITGALYDSTNSPGTGGQLLTSSVTGTAWQSASTALATTAFLQGGNSFGSLATLGTNDANALALRTNGAERLRIDATGKVGIGTTAPSGMLNVVGTGRVALFGDSTLTNQYLELRNGGSGAAFWGLDISQNSGAGGYLLQAGLNKSLHFVVNSDTFGGAMPSMTVSQAGNVGIGTATPANALTVNQAANAVAGITASYGIALFNQGSVNATLGADNNYAYLQSWANKPLALNNQGNNVLTTVRLNEPRRA